MESKPLKVYFIGNDAQFARTVADRLREVGGTIDIATTPSFESGLAAVTGNAFHIVLFELAAANAAGLFQITALAVKAPNMPVIVFGSTSG